MTYIYNGTGFQGGAPPGDPGGHPTGGSQTGSKVSAAASTVPFSENGGFSASTFLLMVPVQNMLNGSVYVGIYNTTSFDDQNEARSYSYRIEDIDPGRMPTVRRVILNYRDLGPAKVTVTVDGTDDNQQPVTKSVTAQLGNKIPTLEPMIKFVDITVTCFQPQLTLSQSAGDGPLRVIWAKMIGEVEESTL